MHLHHEQKATSGADVSTRIPAPLLLRLASFPCCHSHRCVLRRENDDCRALPRVAAATAQKITLSYVAILIASLMRSFADEQMHFPSPLCQLADSIP